MIPLPRNRILGGDARRRLAELPTHSIDCAITSPPYFLLRNYHVKDQIGLEPTVGAWVQRLLALGTELARVLKPTGSLWLNLGDSYSRHRRYGAPPKALLLAPERLLLKLAAQGWLVRNKVVWAKPNPMPTSVRDRLTCSWEPIYLLTRQPKYFFDLDAIREAHTTQRQPRRPSLTRQKYSGRRPTWAGPLAGANDGLIKAHAVGRVGHPLGKNPGDVWRIPTAGFRGAHFATFPLGLLTKPLLATCPERCCKRCGAPWQRVAGELQPLCPCGRTFEPGLVLDPFFGAGTTAIAAERLGRDWLGIELNAGYRQLALERITTAREEVITNNTRRRKTQ